MSLLCGRHREACRGTVYVSVSDQTGFEKSNSKVEAKRVLHPHAKNDSSIIIRAV